MVFIQVCIRHSKLFRSLLRSSCLNHMKFQSFRHFSQVAGPGVENVNKDTFYMKPTPLEGVIEASDPETKDIIAGNFELYENFLSEEDEESLFSEVEPYLKRMRYEFDHWDNAIHGYRETERKHWTEKNKAIIQKARDLAFPPHTPQLPYVHILDIDKTGYVKAHVDSVRFCGSVIAGMCLLSTSVLKVARETDPSCWAKVILRRRAFYVNRDRTRYEFTHEILSEAESIFRGEVVPRDRRISIICRNEPPPHTD